MQPAPETVKEWRRNYALRRYQLKTAKMKDHLGGKCVKCGSKTRLEIHHIDRKRKSFTLTKRYDWPWKEILKELAKCELRCFRCHKTEHAPRHGTISGYRNLRCRCDACKKAWNAACVKWRKTSKLKPAD